MTATFSYRDTCLRAFLRYVQTSAHIDDVIKAMNRGKGVSIIIKYLISVLVLD